MRPALALLSLLLLAAPVMAQPKYNGQWTVGDFRGWPEATQAGYVLGWREQSALLSTRCERNVTNGEYVAAIRYETRLAETDRLSLTMLALEIRNGCRTGGGTR
jgi:hypothetical protein